MWNVKCTIVLVKIGTTGILTRSLKINLEILPGKHSIDPLQKTAILGTSHIIRKVLQCEAWNLSSGDHRCFKKITRKKCLWQRHPCCTTTTTIIIIKIIIIRCKLAVTRWQDLLCMYINMKEEAKKFMSRWLHKRHAVATSSLGNYLSIRIDKAGSSYFLHTSVSYDKSY